MKNNFNLVLIALLIFLTASCDKTEPIDQIPEKFSKKVLIEEFGGEWCSFCVEGAKSFEALLDGDKVHFIGVSLHYDDPFEVKYPSVVNMLLSAFEIISFPNTVVDRTIDKEKSWAVQADYRFSRGTDVGIKAKTEIVNNNLDITIEYASNTGIDTAFLTVYVVEDFVPESSPGAQSGGGGNYVHRHVLRQVLTKKSGNLISLEKGKIQEKTFKGVKLGQYKNSNVTIVAFIHKDSSKSFEVLNATSVKVGEESEW